MGAALLWRSPAARPLKRTPLNRVRWMDCGSDQAGAPATTPTKTPADSGSCVHMRTGRCTRAHSPLPPPPVLRGDCVQLQGETWQRGDQLSSRQMTRGAGGLLIFPAVVLNPAAVDRWQPLSFSSLFVYGTESSLGRTIWQLRRVLCEIILEKYDALLEIRKSLKEVFKDSMTLLITWYVKQ